VKQRGRGTGWVLSSARIVQTTDGGQTWSAGDSALPPSGLRDLHFVNSQHGWAVGENGALYRYVAQRDARMCEERLYRLRVWEGELDWQCDALTKVEGGHSTRLESRSFSNAELYSALIPVLPGQSDRVSSADLALDNSACMLHNGSTVEP
jgi:hypothetical protein